MQQRLIKKTHLLVVLEFECKPQLHTRSANIWHATHLHSHALLCPPHADSYVIRQQFQLAVWQQQNYSK